MLVARLALAALAALAARRALAASAGGRGGRPTALEVAAAALVLRGEVGVGALLRLAAVDFEQRAWRGAGLGLRLKGGWA